MFTSVQLDLHFVTVMNLLSTKTSFCFLNFNVFFSCWLIVARERFMLTKKFGIHLHCFDKKGNWFDTVISQKIISRTFDFYRIPFPKNYLEVVWWYSLTEAWHQSKFLSINTFIQYFSSRNKPIKELAISFVGSNQRSTMKCYDNNRQWNVRNFARIIQGSLQYVVTSWMKLMSLQRLFQFMQFDLKWTLKENFIKVTL